jgi:hypothetical protein
VDKFRERIEIFRSQADHILLSLADHTIGRQHYEAKLDEFKATVLQLRDDYVQDAAPKTIEEIINTNDPIPNLPLGIAIPFGPGGMVSGDVKEMTEEERRDLRESIEWAETGRKRLEIGQKKAKPSTSETSEPEQ